MFAPIVQTAAPALRTAGQFMAPVAKAAARDALKHTTEVVIIYGGAVLVGITGLGLYLGGKRAMHWVKALPHPMVKVTWEPAWTTTTLRLRRLAPAPNPTRSGRSPSMAPQPRRPDTATPRTLALRAGAFRRFRTPCGTQGRSIAGERHNSWPFLHWP
jgi:hypothetical protein